MGNGNPEKGSNFPKVTQLLIGTAWHSQDLHPGSSTPESEFLMFNVWISGVSGKPREACLSRMEKWLTNYGEEDGDVTIGFGSMESIGNFDKNNFKRMLGLKKWNGFMRIREVEAVNLDDSFMEFCSVEEQSNEALTGDRSWVKWDFFFNVDRNASNEMDVLWCGREKDNYKEATPCESEKGWNPGIYTGTILHGYVTFASTVIASGQAWRKQTFKIVRFGAVSGAGDQGTVEKGD